METFLNLMPGYSSYRQEALVLGGSEWPTSFSTHDSELPNTTSNFCRLVSVM
jgi:hypothetical protein